MLGEIDVQHAMKEKLGADMRPYRILGACNPPLAHQVLQAAPTSACSCPAPFAPGANRSAARAGARAFRGMNGPLPTRAALRSTRAGPFH